MNSWDMSDSDWEFVEPEHHQSTDEVKFIAKGDLDLAAIMKAGNDHGKFLRYLDTDITALLVEGI